MPLTIKANKKWINLKEKPEGAPPADKEAIYILGDLHANFLKLIYFLADHGIIELPNQPGERSAYGELIDIDEEISKLKKGTIQEAKGAEEEPNPVPFLKKLKNLMNQTAHHPCKKIILIGDDLCDRGTCDYLTMVAEQSIFASKNPVDIIISNHTCSLLFYFNPKNPELPRLTKEKEYSCMYLGGGDQTLSLQRLQALMDCCPGIKEEMKGFVKEYEKHLVAISYAFSDDNKGIMLCSHARLCFIAIAALRYRLENHEHIKNNITTNESLSNEEKRQLYLKFVEEHIRPQVTARCKVYAENMHELAKDIDIINELFQRHVIQEHNTTVYLWDFHSKTPSDDKLDPVILPFYYLCWNRALPADEINLQYPLTYINGHTGETSTSSNGKQKRIEIDSRLGRPGYDKGSLHSLSVTGVALAHEHVVDNQDDDDVAMTSSAPPPDDSDDKSYYFDLDMFKKPIVESQVQGEVQDSISTTAMPEQLKRCQSLPNMYAPVVVCAKPDEGSVPAESAPPVSQPVKRERSKSVSESTCIDTLRRLNIFDFNRKLETQNNPLIDMHMAIVIPEVFGGCDIKTKCQILNVIVNEIRVKGDISELKIGKSKKGKFFLARNALLDCAPGDLPDKHSDYLTWREEQTFIFDDYQKRHDEVCRIVTKNSISPKDKKMGALQPRRLG